MTKKILTGDVDQRHAPAHAPAPAHEAEGHRHHHGQADDQVHQETADPGVKTHIDASDLAWTWHNGTWVDLSKESDRSCHRGQPTVAWEEQRQNASTRRPDTRVPDPGHRQFSTRHTAADLWLRIGIAPLIMLLVILNNKVETNIEDFYIVEHTSCGSIGLVFESTLIISFFFLSIFTMWSSLSWILRLPFFCTEK